MKFINLKMVQMYSYFRGKIHFLNFEQLFVYLELTVRTVIRYSSIGNINDLTD